VGTDRILKGMGLRLFSALCLATLAAIIKLAQARGAGLIEIMFFRQLAAVPVVVAWLAIGPGLGTIRTPRLGAHATRTAVGLISMAANFGTFLLMPLAEATTLQFTVPIFATILGGLVLGEAIGWHRWGAVCLGFLGVLIVAHPSGAHFSLNGTIVGLTSGLLMAVVAVLLRQLGKTESAGTTVFWFSALSVPPLAILLTLPLLPVPQLAALQPVFGLHTHNAATWAMLIAIGAIGAVGQLALTAALRYGPVSTVVPMDYSSLIWATLYGWFLLGTLPTAYTWAGAPIIIGSGLYIVWREHRRGQPESPVTAADTPA
jgi:drug/metabolite transporter (DMT)-like permease